MNLASVDLNLLKVLDILLEERNVTKASERLGRSQPGVSNALNRLRGLLDDPLLVRGNGGLDLTVRAETMRQPLRDIIRSIESCLTDASTFDPASATGVFRIGAPDNLSLPIIPQLYERMAIHAPKMDLHIITEGLEKAFDSLIQGRIDLALDPATSPKAPIRVQTILKGKYICLVRKDHPIVRMGQKFNSDAFLSFPHILVDSQGARRGLFDQKLAEQNLKRRIAVSVSNFAMVPQFLRNSDMIGVFTPRVCDVLKEDFDLVTLPMPIDTGILDGKMAWLIRHDNDSKHKWFRHEIERIAKDF
ncbi:MAG: LysR family transcriptional regulator [Rhodospirillaceae bacterium]|jgi:LysR family transcriptional regulator, mexEF-oprN operon transcriptional activator|nr:LysR family transcriptional regulator [Rhodospirillaceae bacterium]MBT7955880.1 LysR family transcriptional regulator [Rhodospirillaceae bacterium]